MPVSVTRFGPDGAGTWREAALAPRARWIAVAVAAIGPMAGMAGEPAVLCSSVDPCTPMDIDSFGVFLGLFGLSLLGLWLWPAAGASLGIVAALLDVRYDSSLSARVVFAAYAVVCVHLLIGLHRSRRSQRAVLDEVGAEAVLTSHVPVIAAGRTLWQPGLWLGAAAALVVAVAAFGAFAHAKNADAEHRERAVKASGRVLTGWDDDLRQTVRIDQAGLPDRVTVSGASELPGGMAVRLLVDPTDPTWTELEGDPIDHSSWLALGIFAAGLALGALALIGARAWVDHAHLTDGVAVELSITSGGDALLRPTGGGEPFATFLTAPPAPLSTSGRRRRRVDWQPAIAVGDLRDWGMVKVFTANGVVTPGTPLRTIRPDAGDEDAITSLARAPLGRAWSVVQDRVAVGQVFAVILGLVLAVSSVAMLPDAIAVANGEGVSGTLTITSESCSKSCSYKGDFRSTDGALVLSDVFFEGTGTVGSSWPAVYIASDSEPSVVYEEGNGALLESGFFSLVGLGIAGWPFVSRFLERHTRSSPHS